MAAHTNRQLDTSERGRRRLLIAGVTLLAVVSAITPAGVDAASPSSASAGVVKVGEWPLPGADLQNTRNVPGPIKSSNVATLKRAWSVPIRAAGTFGTYATTPIVVAGTVYTQDINSNVYSINLKTGKVNWFKKYNSPSVGPNGVTVVGGVVYGATGDSAFALQASTGEQLWTKKLTRNKPRGHRHGPRLRTRHALLSTVPGNAKGFYKGNGQAILWALNPKNGRRQVEVGRGPEDLWSKAHATSTRAAGSGIRPRSTQRATSTSASRTLRRSPARRASRTARAAPGRTSTRTPSSSSTTAPASSSGTTSSRRMTSRLGHAELADPDDGQRQERRHRRRQGRHRRRGRPEHRQAALEDAGRHAQRPRQGRPADARRGQEEAQVPIHGVSRHLRRRRVPARDGRHQRLRRRRQSRRPPTPAPSGRRSST